MSDVTALLEFAKVRFAWPGDQHDTIVLDQLSLPQASQVFLHGPSGCGKSTLLSLIAGVITPQQGEIRFMQKACCKLSASARDQLRADHMGYVFQQFNLLPYLSVLDNVTLACHFSARRRAKAEQRSGSVQAEARRLLTQLHFPEARMQQQAAKLSIGQQQRVAVARALIGSPELIVADEPTSALDADNRDRFVELLMAELSLSGSSLLMVSHDRSLAKHFGTSLDLQALNQGVTHGDD